MDRPTGKLRISLWASSVFANEAFLSFDALEVEYAYYIAEIRKEI